MQVPLLGLALHYCKCKHLQRRSRFCVSILLATHILAEGGLLPGCGRHDMLGRAMMLLLHGHLRLRWLLLQG